MQVSKKCKYGKCKLIKVQMRQINIGKSPIVTLNQLLYQYHHPLLYQHPIAAKPFNKFHRYERKRSEKPVLDRRFSIKLTVQRLVMRFFTASLCFSRDFSMGTRYERKKPVQDFVWKPTSQIISNIGHFITTQGRTTRCEKIPYRISFLNQKYPWYKTFNSY